MPKSRDLSEPVMASPRLDRKLVAIMAADVVNFSRLMELDEERTLELLTARRQIIDQFIETHGGRVTGTAGDSVVAEFNSVIDAVDCAVKIQHELIDANQRAETDADLSFRIGINVGDVMVKDADIFGDGVNVAARLETLADADGICVSRGVHEYVRKQTSYVFEDLGEQRVKNIEQPLRAFRVVFEDGRAALSSEPYTEDEIMTDEAAQLQLPEYELTFWESVRDSSDAAEFEAYLDKFPAGTFADLARTRLKVLEETDPEAQVPAADPVELSFWESVKDGETADLFETYLEKYPEGQFADLARLQIDKLSS